ncbi:hypothetical protein ASE09_22985 [Streptomyces sp. Root66D1]|nr:hypothetical protein ASD33_25430 [Streptomyces sp. Root1304]KRA78737.1 hypothetical protein ASE09_22985 [Streptomyces sp. Root66D1]
MLITVLVLLSLGFLAWVAMLRIAIMRRSGRDWALFWAQLVLNIGCVVPLEERFAGTWMNNAGMVVLLVQMALVTGYFLVVDIRHHQPAPIVVMAPPPPPYLPMGHVYAPGTPGTPPAVAPRPDLDGAPNPYTCAPPLPANHGPLPGTQGTVPANQAPLPPHPPRIDQVRAELDELSDLLRKEGEK